jgi:hypothetical protein
VAKDLTMYRNLIQGVGISERKVQKSTRGSKYYIAKISVALQPEITALGQGAIHG